MEVTRRRFLRLAPLSVGAVALGAAVLPEAGVAGLDHLEGETVIVLRDDWNVFNVESVAPLRFPVQWM